MTRTAARELAIRLVFGTAELSDENLREALDCFFDREYYASLHEADELFSEYPDEKQLAYIKALVTGVCEKRDELDSRIKKYSRGWKLSRISRISLAVLRCCIYEILYMPDIPTASSINEAVELSKGYEEADTVAFINGILGSFVREEVENGAANADSNPTE